MLYSNCTLRTVVRVYAGENDGPREEKRVRDLMRKTVRMREREKERETVSE